MTARLKKTIVLIGMMGAGKSAVGGSLACALGVPFLDSDDEIERAARLTITEIFARDGEAFFRRKEAEVIARLIRGKPKVLSTGGGAFLSPSTRRIVAERAVSVWLDADLDLLWTRVRHRKTRPLLRTADPRGTLAQLLEGREEVYALADLRVRAEVAYSIEDMTIAVLEALATRPGVFHEEAGA